MPTPWSCKPHLRHLEPRPESQQIEFPGTGFAVFWSQCRKIIKSSFLGLVCRLLELRLENKQIDFPETRFVDLWTQDLEVIKSSFLVFVLSTSGANARKSLNRASMTIHKSHTTLGSPVAATRMSYLWIETSASHTSHSSLCQFWSLLAHISNSVFRFCCTFCLPPCTSTIGDPCAANCPPTCRPDERNISSPKFHK